MSLAEQNADLGLPVASGSHFRSLRQLIAKATWPMLSHQTVFNHAILEDLSSLRTRVVEVQQSTNQQSISLDHHTEVLVRFEATLAEHNAHLSTVADISAALNALQQKVALMERAMSDLSTNLRNELFAEVGRLREHLEVHSEVSERALAELQMRINQLDLFFAEYRRSLSGSTPDAPPSTASSLPNAFEGIYAALENAFRGSPAVVKDRLKVYLEKVGEATKDGGIVLDLGCGRGEWLEVLSDAGIGAIGVDSNVTYADAWKAKGLQVTTGDVIDHLRSVQPGSVAVVTAFHIVEHLPLDVLIELLDLANRALRPGGLLVLETPNPENLIVGASTFYLDPTHKHPIPPALLQFMVGARGFVDVSITRLQSNDAEALPTPSDNEAWTSDLQPVIEVVNQRFFGPQDYSVTAYHI